MNYLQDNILQPTGELSKVLVTRNMAERQRLKSQKGKKKGSQRYAKGKSKKSVYEKRDGVKSPDSKDIEDADRQGQGVKAEFMEQYHKKKRIEKKLDDEHYWSDEDEKIDHLKLDDDDVSTTV